ncbi:type IV pilin N-terminal domain-containing protein [Methanoculleus sp. UBA374]|jgi:hypothetical protein|uniref:type IV pilin N-terminal domain-containing protein n=1 Tax=Methanoculleus sp. UBA374 TaxID=1915505 RepID=UPI00319DB17E
MNAREESRDAAVSPVIGIMLMLVVTIIIAAVVSSFAGGLGTTKDTTPTVTFNADLSVADGLTITCLGATPGKNVNFDVCVGDSNYYRVGMGSTSTFTPGTSLLYPAKKLTQGFTDAFGEFDGYEGTGMYVPNPSFIGKTYAIQLIDGDSGTTIGKAYAVLTA